MKCIQFIKPFVLGIILLHFISVGLAQKKSEQKKNRGTGEHNRIKGTEGEGQRNNGKGGENRETEQGGDKGQNDRETSGNRNTGEMK